MDIRSLIAFFWFFFFTSRRRHTRCALVTGVQTCALPICKITHLDSSDPASKATALTIKASLEAVGFEVELDLVANIQEQIQKVAIERSYDVAGWGISWREAGPYGRMFATNHSQGNLSAGMPTSPEMDALFDAFQAAESADDQREIMGKIQAEWNELVPALVFAPSAAFMLWSTQVHGVVDSTNSLVLLQDAWISLCSNALIDLFDIRAHACTCRRGLECLVAQRSPWRRDVPGAVQGVVGLRRAAARPDPVAPVGGARSTAEPGRCRRRGRSGRAPSRRERNRGCRGRRSPGPRVLASVQAWVVAGPARLRDRKSTRLNSSH